MEKFSIAYLGQLYSDSIQMTLIYREFSPNANFITANFITAVFQNFPDIFCYCDSMYILLMRYLANAILCAIYFVTAVIS
mgnify:CR=1 FL=1